MIDVCYYAKIAYKLRLILFAEQKPDGPIHKSIDYNNSTINTMLKSLAGLGRLLQFKCIRDKQFFSTERDLIYKKIISTQQSKQKLEVLQDLLARAGIDEYYKNKLIKEMDEIDLFFFLKNRNLFSRQGFRTKRDIIMQSNINIFMKFVMAKELNFPSISEYNFHLINEFNQHFNKLKLQQVVFCLNQIIEFDKQIGQLDMDAFESYIVTEYNKQPSDLILEIVGILIQKKIQFKFITNQLILTHFQKLSKLNFKMIYHIYKISQHYKIGIPQETEAKISQNMVKALSRLHLPEFDSEYMAFLLEYYPEQRKAINKIKFTPNSYISYLDFCIKNNQKVEAHRISQKVIKSSNNHQFRQIINKRTKLLLDNDLTLAKNIKNMFSENLSCVIALLQRFIENDVTDNEVWYEFEKGAQDQLGLNEDFDHAIFQKYDILMIFKLLQILAMRKRGSVAFWKKAMVLVQQAVLVDSNFTHLHGEQQYKFMLYSLEITNNKQCPQKVKEKVYSYVIFLLQKPRFYIKDLSKLTVILNKLKIGEDQIWLLIEKKMIPHMHADLKEQDRTRLLRIVKHFNIFKKGSYKFWKELDTILNAEEKSDIIQGCKSDRNLAKLYFQIKLQAV